MATDANSAIRTLGRGVGLRNVGSYQVSGHPFLTGALLTVGASEKKIEFPYVTKKVTVIASGSTQFPINDGGLRVHFASTSSGDVINGLHFIRLDSHEDAIELDVKCKEMFVSAPDGSGGFMLYASLTNISTSSMYAITGSGITD
jgi:hypothetical protein